MQRRSVRIRSSPGPRSALPLAVRSCGHYAFDSGRIIDQIEGRPFAQLYWGVAGAAVFGFSDGEVVLQAGEVVVYPCGSRHLIRAADSGCEYRWVTFDGPLADAIINGFGLVPPWPRRAGDVPSALFAELERLIAHPGVVAERQAAGVGWALLTAAGTSTGGEDALVRQVQEALLAGMTDPGFAVEGLAARFSIDRSVLSRRFTAAVGLAPKPYLQSLRLGRAMTLLGSSDAQIRDVALACGFSSGNYFARVFKAETGETPEQFRRQVR